MQDHLVRMALRYLRARRYLRDARYKAGLGRSVVSHLLSLRCSVPRWESEAAVLRALHAMKKGKVRS